MKRAKGGEDWTKLNTWVSSHLAHAVFLREGLQRASLMEGVRSMNLCGELWIELSLPTPVNIAGWAVRGKVNPSQMAVHIFHTWHHAAPRAVSLFANV